MARKKKRSWWDPVPFQFTDPAEAAVTATEGVADIVGAAELGLRRSRGRSIESPLPKVSASSAPPAAPRSAGAGSAASAPAARTAPPSPSAPAGQPVRPPAQPVGANRPPNQIVPTAPGRGIRPPSRFGR